MDKKKEEAYKEKPDNLKDTFEFDKKNMKEEDNKDLNKEAKEKNKKKDDDLMDRFDAFAEGFM